jgi:hypothetical protein
MDKDVKVFRISDLMTTKSKIGNETLKPYETKGRKNGKRKYNNSTVSMEASSFKFSNKLTTHGTKQKKIKKSSRDHANILWQHELKMKFFSDLQDSLIFKEKEFETTTNWNEKQRLGKEIESIKNHEDELMYISATKEIIEDYEKMINLDKNVETTNTASMKKDTTGKITQYITKYNNVTKDKLTEEYARIVNNIVTIDKNKLKINNSFCELCNNETIINEGYITCTSCGTISEQSIQDFQNSYKDICDISIKNQFSYKRINRFNEILSTLQAKENTNIPDYVITTVHNEISKEKSIDTSNIDIFKIKYYLKRLSLTQYYEHAPHILNQINGIIPVKIPQYVEDKFREMFKDIQDPFENVKSDLCPDRLSFLSYNYVLYKFCELLDLDEYKIYFPLLKSVEKLRIQDKIWKGICNQLDWVFVSSV